MEQSANLSRRSAARTVVVLSLLAALAVASNATKAVHIDDTAYLEIARAIRDDPLHVMSKGLSWMREREPIHAVNQPHLFLYGLAATMCVCGECDVAFHVTESAFTVMALLFFHALVRCFLPRDALFLSALFILGPALLPGQNVMCDVPMLAFWLAFLWALLTPRGGHGAADPLLAAVLAAAACLVKYTSLVLLPVLAIDLLWRGERRRFWVLLVPIAILGAWSLFNYLDYGGIHLLGRESSSKDMDALVTRLAVYFVCLGAVTPFSILLFPRLMRSRLGLLAIVLALGSGVGSLYWSWAYLHEIPVWRGVLRAVFLANGVLVFVGSLVVGRSKIEMGSEESRPFVVLASLLLGSTAFIVLFAPFVAVRHALPAVAVILLLIALADTRYATARVAYRWRVVALVGTAALGMALTVSDWLLADVYRTMAPRLAAELMETKGEATQSTVWYVGHWGWQWYADRAGMRQYEPGESVLREGDYLIVPEMVPRQRIADEDWARRQRLRYVAVPSGPGTILRTMGKTPLGGYYAIGERALPWFPSKEPLDEFTIFRIGP